MSPVQDSLILPFIENLQPKITSPLFHKTTIKNPCFLKYGFIFLNISTLAIIGLGIYTLRISPYTGIRLAITDNTWIVNHKDYNSPSAASSITIEDKLNTVQHDV